MNAKQKAQLTKHASYHSTKHMAMMRKLIKEGMSFTAAHKKTDSVCLFSMEAIILIFFGNIRINFQFYFSTTVS